MARFDVYPNQGEGSKSTPYLLDVQAELLDGLESRMVIPLRRLDRFPKIEIPARLMPVLKVAGKRYLLETPKMAAIPRRILKVPIVNLAEDRDRVTAALDFLFQGY